MTLFHARNIVGNIRRKEVPRPAPFSYEIARWRGWVVFCCEDHFEEGHDAYMAIHEDTGAQQRFDVTGWRHVRHDVQIFRDLIDLGFPTRCDAGVLGRLTAEDVARLKKENAA